ncbi:hypothetical protein [Mesorhizobium sp.]|uniref:hypothetical protein n=1 Tax=Mesorhizobium sp. TaxID=1871066 RepID=UPI0025B87A3C|nr:hypothetical protein [Mesorhizobium sp.]
MAHAAGSDAKKSRRVRTDVAELPACVAEDSRSAIGKRISAFLLRAVDATVDDVTLLDAMPNDADLAMGTDRRELLDRAFEAVECVGFSSQM